MKPPFVSSGGDTPPSASELAKALPGGGGLPSVPGMPDLPGIPDIPDLPDLPNCLPGSCDALWNAVDKGLSPVKDMMDGAAKAAGDAKDKAAKAVGDVKDKATKAVDEAKDKATKAADEAKAKAQKAIDDVKAKAAKAAEDAKAAVQQKAGEAATYAQQFLDNPALAWAGLQGVASRQAACAMEEASKAVDKAAKAASDAADNAKNAVGKAADDALAFAKAQADEARKGADALKDSLTSAGNTAYDTIAPVTQFYKGNGLDKLTECGSIPGRPEVPAALTDALEQIDKGTQEAVRAGSDMIAQVEQADVMEKAIYEAERHAKEFGSMADKTVTDLTDAIPTEFPMSSTCGGPPIPFDGSMLDPDARQRYFNQMMDEFQKKGKDEAEKMMKDIVKAAKDGAGNPLKDVPKGAKL